MVEQFSCLKCLYMFIVLYDILFILQHSSGGIVCIGFHSLYEQETSVYCVVQVNLMFIRFQSESLLYIYYSSVTWMILCPSLASIQVSGDVV